MAVGDKLKYILATENMKAGDILKTSRYLPRIPGKFYSDNFIYCRLFKKVHNVSIHKLAQYKTQAHLKVYVFKDK